MGLSFVKAFIVKIFRLILSIFGAFRRALCCFRRKKDQDSCEALPFRIDKPSLPEIPILSDNSFNNVNLQNWQDWNENYDALASVNVVQENSSSKYKSYSSQTKELESEPEVNYFQDMTPDIKRQRKVLMHNTKEENSDNNTSCKSRLSFDLSAPSIQTQGPDLASWDETGDTVTTWEEDMVFEDNIDTEAIIKEKRKDERQRRIAEQQKKKVDKMKNKKINLEATKVS